MPGTQLITYKKMVQLAINTIRALSIDAVQQAKSGHPGTPMALAPLVFTIGTKNRPCQWVIAPGRLEDSSNDKCLRSTGLKPNLFLPPV